MVHLLSKSCNLAGKIEEKYMGFERWWLPAAPKVKKPRSTYNAVSLAYLGDCIYEVLLLPLIGFTFIGVF